MKFKIKTGMTSNQINHIKVFQALVKLYIMLINGKNL